MLRQLSVQAGEQRDILYNGLDEIPDVIYILTEIEKLHWNDKQEPIVRKSIIELCSHILEFLARAACHLEKKSAARKLVDMFNQENWDDLLSNIKKAQALVEQHSTVKFQTEIRAIAKETRAILELVEKVATRHDKITAFLQKLNEYAWSGGDSYESSIKRVEYPEKGTCKWFINHDKFKAWESPTI